MATKIQGLDRLKRKLGQFPTVVREEIAKAMEQSANEIVSLAKSLAPVDDGDLQMSISWTWGDAPKGSMVLGQVKSSGKGAGNMQITVFAGGGDAFYARFIEFGTAPHVNGGRFAGSQHPGTSAQPFFYPAYRATRKRAKSRVTRAVNKAAKRIAAGG
jgi:HK97 gp10 family phage protein